MDIVIKYSMMDYFRAVWFKLTHMLRGIKSKGHTGSYFVLLTIKPFVALYLSIKASLGRLKPTYHYVFNETGLTRTHDGIEGQLSWDRFHCYHETASLILLEFILEGDDSPSEILVPKRLLTPEQEVNLKTMLTQHRIKPSYY